jgi:hypothetical protein
MAYKAQDEDLESDRLTASPDPGRRAVSSGGRAGLYCAYHLGDEPTFSRSGCRYYVYIGRTCEAWLDYQSIETAEDENPGQPIFERGAFEEAFGLAGGGQGP